MALMETNGRADAALQHSFLFYFYLFVYVRTNLSAPPPPLLLLLVPFLFRGCTCTVGNVLPGRAGRVNPQQMRSSPPLLFAHVHYDAAYKQRECYKMYGLSQSA